MVDSSNNPAPSNKAQRPSGFRRLYNFSVKWWWLSSVIAVLPSGYSLFLQFFGVNFGIIGEDGYISTPWLIFTIILLCVSGVFIILRFYADSIDHRNSSNAVTVYRNIIKSNEKTCNDRCFDFISIIKDSHYKAAYTNVEIKPHSPYDNSSSRLNPISAIKKKMEDVRELLHTLFDIDSTNMSITLAVRKQSGDWVCPYTLVASDHNDDILKFLAPKQASAFNTAYEKGIVFYPDKKVAVQDNCYIFDQAETEMHARNMCVVGSIYCKNISIKSETGIILPALFCVNTYGKQVCPVEDIPAQEKVKDLFSGIESSIKLELARLCVYEHLGLAHTSYMS